MIGVTGGTGAGKTEVCKIFERLGAKVISADEVGHRILEDPEVKEKLLEEFGRGILGEDGRIDRRKLGRIAFGDRAALARLDAIVHPPLLRRLKEEVSESFREDPVRPIVVDAALIPKWGISDWFDAVILVKAPKEVRVARLVEGGLSEEEALMRTEAQMTEEEMERAASHVLENEGSLEELEGKVRSLWRNLKEGGWLRSCS